MKNIKNQLVVYALAIVMGLSFAGVSEARQGDNKLQKMTERLNLNEAQVQAIEQIYQKHKENKSGKKDALKAAYQDLNQSFQSEASEAQLRQKFQALQKLKQEMAELRFNKILEVRAVLTPEQRQEFKAMMKDKHRGPHKSGDKYKGKK